MKILAAYLLACTAISSARAASFIPQASFGVAGGTVAGMDRDAAGNLYVLALVPGTTASYTVSSYLPPSLAPEFSFGVTITTPLAFAVEANGVIDILDAGNALTLTRWNNAGALISQVSRISPYMKSYFGAAFDKANSLFYFSYPSAVTQATGDFSVNILYYQGAVSQYSFSGQLQRVFDLPGRSSISTTCYTPSMLSVDDQSTLWVGDPVCNHLLAYNSLGAKLNDIPLPYTYYPRSLWTGPGENVFMANSVCDINGCPHGLLLEFNSSGVQQNAAQTSSTMGEAWDSRILYLAAPSGATLQRFILDAAPTVPVPSSPQGFVVQHSSTAAMNWQAAGDADGDPLLYSVYIGASPSQLSFAGSTTQTSFASTPLAFGANYYWQVTAQDSYLGLPMLTSTGAVVGFDLSLVNSPPVAFMATVGTGTAVTRGTSVTLGWTAAVDPDGDPVVYDVLWGASALSLSQLGTTSATSWRVGGLGFGATYYWSVRARDVYNAATLLSGGATQTYSQVFENLPPPAPGIVSGSGVLPEHTLTPTATLSWSASIDPDGDSVAYRLYVGPTPGSMTLAQDGTQTSYSLGGVSFGTTYYWEVSAYDPYGGVGTTAVQSLVVLLQNNPPQAFAVLTGTGTLATRNAAQTLSWAAAADPDGDTVTYELDLSTNPAALAPVQTSTSTSFSLSFQLGTTYYWQALARDGFGGVTPSGLQSFLPVFLNHPPTAPVNQSKTGTIPYHGVAPSQSFFWQPSTDPDGDPVTYSLYYGTDSSHMSVVNPAPLGFTLSTVPLNTALYYSIVATDIYGAASLSPVNWVYYQFVNSPPGPFDVIGTTGTVYTRQTSANLWWTASTDPDGDSVSYGVLSGTSPASLALLTNTTKTSAVLSSMAFGTTYYWRVDAYDGFGGTTTVNAGVQSLVYLFDTTPPPAPAILQSTGTLLEHALAARVPLSWSAVQDSDGDPIAYFLSVGTSTAGLVQVQASTQTSALITNPTFGVTYYWQVSARNPYGGAGTTTVQSVVPVFMNHPPDAFAVALGSGTLATRTTTQMLAWSAAGDPDGDAVTYALSLSTWTAGLAVVQTSTVTTFPLSFQYGTTYYWSVAAFDGFGGTTTISGGTQSFLASFLNPAPQVVQIAPQLVITTMRGSATVSWQQVTNPEGDPVSYTVYFGNSAGDLQPFAQIAPATPTGAAAQSVRVLISRPLAQVRVNGNTVTLTLPDLDYYRTYYIQVQAANQYGATSLSPVQTFTLGTTSGFPSAYNFPNPFSPLRGGTNLVFNAPPSGYARATVSVYSEFGDLLFKRDYQNIAPGISQVTFDGRDRYGRPLFNGSYVCRVRFEGPDDHATFYLLVVK